MLVEELGVLAGGGRARIAAGERGRELGEDLRELVVVLASAVHGRERGAAERIARRERGGLLQRLLCLDKVPTREIDDAAGTPQRGRGAWIELDAGRGRVGGGSSSSSGLVPAVQPDHVISVVGG
ncbi:MAG: hypothetical protein WKG01_05265 [Kofleriaceae bacterium]